MASGHLSCTRIIRRGFVHFIHGNKNPTLKYFKAVCGDNGEQSARIEVYEKFDSASREGPIICKIEFTNVKNVSYIEEKETKTIAIRMQKGNTNFSFYAEPQCDTIKWYNCCVLLFKIPKYGIPEIPKEKTALQQDGDNKSIVNILSEGIGKTLINKPCACAVVICNRKSTLSIYALDNGKHLLTWHRSNIKLSGYINSVVFVEVDETCHGGPGCLWMESLIPKSTIFQRQIHNFYTGHQEQNLVKTPSPIGYMFVDSALSGLSIKDNGDQLSQTSYEDEVSESDALASATTSTPISSLRTSCSSGYYSGSSYVDGSVSLKSPSSESTGRVSHPDLPALVEHVGSFVSTKWYNLGLKLGVRAHTLDSIEHDVRECNTACRKMFQAWLKDNCKGTWNDVITALRSNCVKEDGVADKLEEMIVS